MIKNYKDITTNAYKERVLKRMIILCWVVLGLCVIVKIFGGNFFNIVCNDERFIAVCNYIDNSFMYYVVSGATSAITHYLVWALMFNKNKFSRNEMSILALVFIITFIGQSVMYYYGLSNYIIFFSVIRYIILPLLMKCNWKRVLVVNVLDIAFQLVSMFIKSVEVFTFDTNTLIALIFMIDYYIMFVICNLYMYQIRLKKGVK